MLKPRFEQWKSALSKNNPYSCLLCPVSKLIDQEHKMVALGGLEG